MMMIRFTKMQGCGNDFVVIDAVSQRLYVNAEQVQKLAHRQLGIGCDQLILVEPPCAPENDFFYRVYNNTGEEVEMCGNGARCFARFVVDAGLTDKTELRLETQKRVITTQLMEEDDVMVDMGTPVLVPAQIPFLTPYQANVYRLEVDGVDHMISAVSMGNPHAVLVVDDVETADVAQLGPKIEGHRQFPEGVNVGFMQIVNDNEINLRVYERNAGETLACGSGACAAVVAGVMRNLLKGEVLVHLPGGTLKIYYDQDKNTVLMQGEAIAVFSGRFRAL